MMAPADDYQDASMMKGCPIITFNAIEGGVYRGLYYSNNFQQEWNNVRFHGGTHIMDGFRTMLRTYENAFTEQPEATWPLLLCLIITDGELQDGHEFESHLKHVHGRVFVEIAVVGYGEDHDAALRHYKRISKHHHHVRVTGFTDETDPNAIAAQLLSLVDPRLIQRVQ